MVVTFGGADKTKHEIHEKLREDLDAKECGIRCKLGKSFLGEKAYSNITQSIKKTQDDNRRKKAEKYGVTLEDYDKAVKEAKTRGKKKAYDSFLGDVERKYAGPKSNTQRAKKAGSTLDQILGSIAGEPKRRTTRRKTRRKTPSRAGKFTIIGGVAYPVATNQSKKRKTRRKSSKRKSNDYMGKNPAFFSF